jgi:TPR repeat protein
MISEISRIPRGDVPTTMTKLFLSYRRDDSADITGRIYDRLESHFGRDHVFRDLDAIPFGLDFRRAIDEAVGKCQVALVVIGTEWVTIQDGKGRQRLAIPNDFVRMEVETALKRSIPVIPVLVGGANMPTADELPQSLAELAYRNFIPVRRDPDFRTDVERLICGIQHLLKLEEAKGENQRPLWPLIPGEFSDLKLKEAEAEYQRGLDFYHERRGVTKDYVEAAKAYEKAALSGHALAQHYLGWLYQNGWGVGQNYAEAMRWYKMAADQGYATAQCNIGSLYQNGQGVSQDYAEAMRWYKMAADQGNADAQYNIGSLYLNGWGVKQDDAEAMRWYKMAADQGNASAQINIGSFYTNGWGVPKDSVKAIEWFRKAAAQGNQNAKDWLKSLGAT